MLNLQKIVKPWKESGALNAQLNLYGFWNQTTFVTKSGGLGTVIRVEGIDYESLDKSGQIAAVKRLENAMRIFGPEFHVYQYLIKQNHPDMPFEKYGIPLVDNMIEQRKEFFKQKAARLYEISTFWVFVYENRRNRPGLRSTLSGFLSNAFRDPIQSSRDLFGELQTLFTGEGMTRLLRSELDEDAVTLSRTVSSFLRNLRQNSKANVLEMDEQLAFLRSLINYDKYRIIGKPRSSQYLDYQIANSTIEANPDHLHVGAHYVRVLSMKESPSETKPRVLDSILKMDANYIICMEWNVLSTAAAKKMVNSRRRHHNVAKGGFAFSTEKKSERDDLVDEGSQNDVDQLGVVLKQLGDGVQMGELSMTVVLVSKSLKSLEHDAANFASVMADLDGVLIAETYNQLNAYLSIVPGNTVHNLRRMLMLNTNYADMSFLFTIHSGNKRNGYLKSEYLAVLETTNKTPYYLNLHDGEIGHTLVLGQIGSGKSFLCNFLLNNAQKYRPITYIFDIGGSFRSMTEMYGGVYINVGQDSKEFHINPFCLEPTTENLEFLFSFIRVLIENNKKYALSIEDEKTVWFALKAIYRIDPEFRTMSTFASLVGPLKPMFERWTQGGQYGWLFDNAVDSVTFSTFQTYNFQGWGDTSDALPPLLFYVLHRASNAICDPANAAVLKIFLLDEAWKFFEHPVILAYILEAQKVWRKLRGMMIMATQNAEDLQKSGMLDVVTTACATKIFLANPDLNKKFYAESFHLTDTDTELIAGLNPPGEMVIRRARASKKVLLEVDSLSYWMATNNANDNVLKTDYFKRYGVAEGISNLAIEHPFTPRSK
jgi:type IV secretion system protein VirB4